MRGCSRIRFIKDVVDEKVPSAEAAQDLGKLSNYLNNFPSYFIDLFDDFSIIESVNIVQIRIVTWNKESKFI